MHKLVILALALFATLVQGGGLYGGGLYGAGPVIQQVRTIPAQVAGLLGGSAAAAASSPAQVYAARPAILGRSYGPSYAPSVAYAPVRSVVAAAPVRVPIRAVAPAYGPGIGLGLGHGLGRAVRVSSGLGYGRGIGYGRGGYGRSWAVQPLAAAQLTGGPTRYRTYQSPPSYSTVALPVLPSAPVAKLFIPKRTAYGVGPAY